MWRKRILLYCSIIIFNLLFVSCKHETLPTPLPTEVSYTNDIAPIMRSYCAYSGCHITGNNDNFPLVKYSDLLDYGGVIPYKPLESDFYDVIVRNYMPLGDTLPLAEKELIYNWISNGALDN